MGPKAVMIRMAGKVQRFFSNKRLPSSVVGFRATEKPWDRWDIEQDPVVGGSHIQQRVLVEEFVEALPLGQTVVELGCGTGKIADSIVNMRNVDQYVGMDVNANALRMAEEHIKANPNAKKATFIHCDASSKIPLLEGSATCVIGVGLFPEVPDLGKTFQEVNRILRPGGLVVGDFDAQETSIGHFVKRHGMRKFLWMTVCHDIGLMLSFNEKLFNWFGKRGFTRLMFYHESDVNKIVSRHFTMNFIRTFGYYHFFAARKQ